MAKLSREAYDGRREWAARRMAENAKIDSLTQEQHDLLAELCTFRHNLHCSWDSLANGNAQDIEAQISEYYEDTLSDRTRRLFGEAAYNLIDYNTTADDPEDVEEYMGIPTDLYNDDYNEWCERIREADFDLFSTINSEIESFLTRIDNKYGTSYAPSGATRF